MFTVYGIGDHSGWLAAGQSKQSWSEKITLSQQQYADWRECAEVYNIINSSLWPETTSYLS